MKKKSLLLMFVLLFMLGCSFSTLKTSLSGLLENIEIRIVTPASNYRVTDKFVEGQTTYVPVTIYYLGTYDRKTALIMVNGVGPFSCDLVSGQEVNCGSAPLSTLGGQNIKVQVNKANGVDMVVKEVNFRWEPYKGLEEFAYNFSGYVGDKSAPMGFLYLGFLALVVAGFLTLFFIMKFGYIHRQGDGVSVTFKDAEGRTLDYEETRGAFTGPGDKDQDRPKLEPAFFRAASQLLISDSKAQKQILLSQGDMEVED